MKLIDRYIIKKFLGTFFFIMALLLSISIVFDISEKIEEFIESKAPIDRIIFDYYLNFIVFYGNLFSALFIFISVIWFTSKMSSNSEIVAILNGGMSFPRMLLPYFISATILAGISIYLNHYVIPVSNQVRIEFENQYMRDPYRIEENDFHREIAPGKIVFFEEFHTRYDRGDRFSMENWKENGELSSKMFARRAKWDSLDGKWKLKGFFIRHFEGDSSWIEEKEDMDTTLGFQPKDLGQRLSSAATLTYSQLNERIQKERAKGSEDVIHYQLEKERRTAFPMAAYVLTLIGVSIASRKVRGGLGLHITLGLVIAVSYIFLMKVTTVAATNAGVAPFLAVWIPNVFYLIVALFIYYTAPK